MSASHEVEGVVVCRNQLSRCRKFWDSRERVGGEGEWIECMNGWEWVGVDK